MNYKNSLMAESKINLKKVSVHNLKKVDLTLDSHQLIVFTGVSGSGKSSLAFDTIYVEGQRRYIESLPSMTRRHMAEMQKPEAESITGISPTIAIEQKTTGKNPRSSVGTLTGIYDFLRILFAKVGVAHCPVSGERVVPQTIKQIFESIKSLPLGSKIIILAPYAEGKKGEFKEEFSHLMRKGITRVRLDGKIIEINEKLSLDGAVAHDVDLLLDRLIIKEDVDSRLLEGLKQALELGNGVVKIFLPNAEEELLYSLHAYSPKSGLSYPPLEAQDFSFNHPKGMCEQCQGLGTVQEFDLDLILDPNLSIADDCCKIASSYRTVRFGNIYDNLARQYKFSVKTPWKDLPEKAKKVFLYGTEKKWLQLQCVHPITKARWTDYVQWRGVLHEAHRRYEEATSDFYRDRIKELMREMICPVCHGERIKPYPAATLFEGKRIAEITALSLAEAIDFFQEITPDLISEELLKEIIHRLLLLKNVGLGYLSLDRIAPTLSGGEAQRVRLASQIGAGLVNATYILDEPSVGLHPRDNLKLLATLKHLRDKGNTVIVVEHDEETILEADHIVDIGPGAGANGGEIIAEGTAYDIAHHPTSLTGAYLSRRKEIPIPKKRRKKGKNELLVKAAEHHNLKKIDVAIPLNLFVAVTGVSGSGKSSLIMEIVYPAIANRLHRSKLPIGKHQGILGSDALEKIISIDQSPIGRTPRSNPATYIKLFDLIREFYCELPESKAKGFTPGQFSFNVKEGSCPHCLGMGMIRIDMDFMEDQWVRCTQCEGKRFDDETLAIRYKGKTISDVLEMSVAEAREFFSAHPKVMDKLNLLSLIGLDYIKIGQPSPTLSGGEAQRIKLAKELSRRDHGHALYILDEPTTGLHFDDAKKLIAILHSLVDRGNSMIVIEHNMDLVKTADWIIDIGPEAGKSGGEVVGSAPPEKIIELDTATGVALKTTMGPPPLIKPVKAAAKREKLHRFCLATDVAQNNLKNLNISFPLEKITICTGPSGSGKSSFAFETIYAEGQRRYIESLSNYARQFVKQMPKPKVENIEGLSASIAIEQKQHAGNPRSTVGTITEGYDYLRILYAYLGIAYCPETLEPIESISKNFVLNELMKLPEKTKIQILSPITLERNETFEGLKERLQRLGFLRIRLNGTYYELEEEMAFDPLRKNRIELVIDRLIIKPDMKDRIFEAISKAAELSKGQIYIDEEGTNHFYNLTFAVKSTGKSYPPITPHTFSFNTERGMCPDCEGIGLQYGANFEKDPAVMRMTSLSLIKNLWKDFLSDEALDLFIEVLKQEKIDPKMRLERLSAEALKVLFQGAAPIKKERYRWIGINTALSRLVKTSRGELKQTLLPLLSEFTCPSCQGTRLNPLARNVRLQGLTMGEFCNLPIDQALEFLNALPFPAGTSYLEEAYLGVKKRLEFLSSIGLHYLSLNRSAPTLSGGEAQRIHLSKQLGSGLTGCLYILDEPTIGLHPHNVAALNHALRHLADLGNTLLLVEHDPLTIAIADHILDFGPKAGMLGGELCASGTLQEIKKNPNSLTGAYLTGKKEIPIPKKRRSFTKSISIKNASLNNLKNLTLSIPLEVFTCVTGVSGSGKSTLINDLLRPAIELGLNQRKDKIDYLGAEISGFGSITKLIAIDQNPIGQTIRADISTYTDLAPALRSFFASLPLAKAKGLQPRHFSPNHRHGMCMACQGLGTRKIEMQFLPPLHVLCETCEGFRLNPSSLEVKYEGKHLGQILNMTVSEASEFLAFFPKAKRILDTLLSVGLDYLELSRPLASLSGGEAQRIRLSRELSKRASGKTLYLFDEPTIGLHSEDLLKLLPIFHKLVDKGHTLVIIEHNLDIIKNCDQIIDLGPEAGIAGGELVTCGTPEIVASHTTSFTARYLRETSED
jgi:excinuclease ABC subunit A